MIMTPAENIYRSDFDDVDGLDPVQFTNDSIDNLREMVEDYREDDQYESVLYDDVDDGQPDMDREYADLYGYGDEYDCVNDIFDYPEDWGV
tara:strand:- start:158 stop:430 length:273 start_codon:yes stop_codon:yes gene_type:complete